METETVMVPSASANPSKKTPTTLTAAAGEHYVAYLLSTRGYIAALTRGGTPSVDILASNIAGTRTVGIQVKTAQWAYRERKKKTEESHWEFDVGFKAVGNRSDTFLYAFVNLWGDKPELQQKPLVFFVSPSVVADALGNGYKRNMFWIRILERAKHENNWTLIEQYLGK